MRTVRVILGVVCAARVAAAGAIVEPAGEPSASGEPSAEPAVPGDDCDRTYGEVTFGAGASKYLSGDILNGEAVVLNRAAFGRAVRFGCTDGLEVRFGLFLDMASGDFARSMFMGIGLELEVNTPITATKRLGARLSLEHHGFLRESTSDGSTVIPTLGARLRYGESAALGLDAFYIRYNSDLWGRSTAAGLMGTVGIDGRRITMVNTAVLLLGFGVAFLIATAP